MEEKRNAYRILAGKPEGRRVLGRQRHRWVDNILERQDGMVWIELSGCTIGSFSRGAQLRE
jgi:hypothetical protein